MKIGRIRRAGLDGPVARVVAVQPERDVVIDLQTAEVRRLERAGATPDGARRLAAALFPGSLTAALEAGPAFRDAAERALLVAGEMPEATLPLGEVDWLPPADPPFMRDGMAFEQHIRNLAVQATGRMPEVHFELPVYYKCNPFSLIGHGATTLWPDYSARMDYELELGFVIGRDGYDLTPANALDFLFGVTIYADYSARDIQQKEGSGRLGPAKGKDFCTGLGPWMTTLDELDVHNLTMVARVNGEEWSRGNSSTLWYRVEEILAWHSRAEGVHVGELIGSGTVGFGCGAELGRFLNPGDVVELEVSGVGVLRNVIGQPRPAGWWPARRTSAFPPVELAPSGPPLPGQPSTQPSRDASA